MPILPYYVFGSVNIAYKTFTAASHCLKQAYRHTLNVTRKYIHSAIIIKLPKLVPLDNAHPLVAVLVGIWVFAEWTPVQPLKLLAGSLLIVAGSVLVAKA